MSLKEALRSHCPDILLLRKFLARLKSRQYYRYIMPEAVISNCEQNLDDKVRTVDEYCVKWPDYTAEVDKEIENLFFRAPVYQTRKDRNFLRMDMRFCRFAYGFQPDEYLGFKLEHKSMEERQAYISDIDRYRYAVMMNDPIEFVVYMDKAATYKQFSRYYKREAIEISSKDDYEKFNNFIHKFPVFVCKRVDLSRGEGVSLVDIHKVTEENKVSLKDYFTNLVSQGKMILEERVVQAAELAALYSGSVNTIRCATFHTRDGYKVAWTFLRVGQGGSFVDNGGAGGILLGVDENIGVVVTDGVDELGNRYELHPQTGVYFKGYKIPEWEQMTALCKELSSQTPKVKYVSWDMAYTDNGWVVIEGNGMAQMIVPQLVAQRGYKEKVEALMKEMDLLF